MFLFNFSLYQSIIYALRRRKGAFSTLFPLSSAMLRQAFIRFTIWLSNAATNAAFEDATNERSGKVWGSGASWGKKKERCDGRFSWSSIWSPVLFFLPTFFFPLASWLRASRREHATNDNATATATAAHQQQQQQQQGDSSSSNISNLQLATGNLQLATGNQFRSVSALLSIFMCACTPWGMQYIFIYIYTRIYPQQIGPIGGFMGEWRSDRTAML